MYTINFHIVFVLLVGALWHRNNCFSIELSRKLNVHSSAGYMTVMEEDIQPKELQHRDMQTLLLEPVGEFGTTQLWTITCAER